MKFRLRLEALCPIYAPVGGTVTDPSSTPEPTTPPPPAAQQPAPFQPIGQPQAPPDNEPAVAV